ncbi:carboxylesterase family protein [Corynebacterium sp. NPDC060344]|uniref:carboxylesterase family protein n=1 Tax=Corynebacterium sp. NPDC060344 TaxID=3347101 RepID=UPI003669F94C
MSHSDATPIPGARPGSAEITVDAPAGALTGHVSDGILRIHTIPYATAEPFGPSSPVPPGAHDGREPIGDPMGDGSGTPLRQGVGHMQLTVTAPASVVKRNAGPGRPILLWIHGGRFEEGHPSEPWCTMRRFAQEGIVAVSLGYRKTLDGFWRTAGEGRVGEPGAAPYRAVDDLLHALRWVRDNAAAFGADPGNVTLSGQSAGAGLALALASDARSTGLVHRVIALSPGLSRGSGSALRRLLARLGGIGPSGAPSPEIADKAYRLLAAVAPTDTAVGPRIREIRPRVPLMVTATSEEFHFVPPLIRADGLPGARMLARAIGAAHGATGPLPPEAGDRPVGGVISDAAIRASAVAVADSSAAAGMPTWVGEFRPGEGTGIGPDGRVTDGAPHCVDLARFFGREAGHPFHDQVVSFIRTGDPGWPRYSPPQRTGRIWFGGGAQAVEADEPDPWGGVRAMFGRA